MYIGLKYNKDKNRYEVSKNYPSKNLNINNSLALNNKISWLYDEYGKIQKLNISKNVDIKNLYMSEVKNLKITINAENFNRGYTYYLPKLEKLFISYKSHFKFGINIDASRLKKIEIKYKSNKNTIEIPDGYHIKSIRSYMVDTFRITYENSFEQITKYYDLNALLCCSIPVEKASLIHISEDLIENNEIHIKNKNIDLLEQNSLNIKKIVFHDIEDVKLDDVVNEYTEILEFFYTKDIKLPSIIYTKKDMLNIKKIRIYSHGKYEDINIPEYHKIRSIISAGGIMLKLISDNGDIAAIKVTNHNGVIDKYIEYHPVSYVKPDNSFEKIKIIFPSQCHISAGNFIKRNLYMDLSDLTLLDRYNVVSDICVRKNEAEVINLILPPIEKNKEFIYNEYCTNGEMIKEYKICVETNKTNVLDDNFEYLLADNKGCSKHIIMENDKYIIDMDDRFETTITIDEKFSVEMLNTTDSNKIDEETGNKVLELISNKLKKGN